MYRDDGVDLTVLCWVRERHRTMVPGRQTYSSFQFLLQWRHVLHLNCILLLAVLFILDFIFISFLQVTHF